MGKYTVEELDRALQIVASTISICEKTQLKFKEGTSQHTLLKNRIKAMYISKMLITEGNALSRFASEELLEALPPISSIINKCKKAQLKFTNGTTYHTRFKNLIEAMDISKALITDEIHRRSQQ
jgi:hypothetical protein